MGPKAPLLLLLLQMLILVYADHAQDAVVGRGRRHLSWSDWSKNDKTPPHAVKQLYSEDEEKLREGIRFELYTRDNPSEPELIDIYEGGWKDPLQYFDARRPTKVVTHGWQSDGVTTRQLMTAFLNNSDVNFISVNWTKVDTLFYPWARWQVPLIGQHVAYLLDFLRMKQGVPLDEVHLIGHSLGAHISGMAGTLVQWGVVGRITGLDPAGPLFPLDPSKRLDSSDALFVDVIHTCANVLGFMKPIGHVDFFPNGGTCIQPGCTYYDLTRGTCSHNRAFDYMEESVRKRGSFKALPCSGVNGTPDFSDPTKAIVMGLDAPTNANGTYCLSTHDSYPFSMTVEEMRTHSLREMDASPRLKSSSGGTDTREVDDEVGNDVPDPAGREAAEARRSGRILRSFMRSGLRRQRGGQ